SDQASSGFGISVSTAGDVNGDGFSDVIVGAHLFSGDEVDAGAVFLYLGSADGLNTSSSWTGQGDQVDAWFGRSVATAGDINGDGYSDVVVGACLNGNGQYQEGAAFCFFGSASGPGSAPNWSAEINHESALFGTSVATAGDVNGDGFADVIVGAPGYSNSEISEGAAFLYFGSSSGLGASPVWTAESQQWGAEFGASVSTAGDVNGDGFSDVLVGAPRHDNFTSDEGRAFLYLGSPAALSQSPGWSADSNNAASEFGWSVASAGDVNADGYSDVIVSAWLFDNGETNEGRAYVYLGSENGLGLSPAWTAEGNQADARFGSSVASAGDINGDGYSDVIVGEEAFSDEDTQEGRALVYFGSAAGLSSSAAWTAEGDQYMAYFGRSVATAGDVNGDGYSDVIVGAYGYDHGQSDEGRAFLYLGSPAGLSLSAAWTAEGDCDSAFFATSVATAGDVNRDGYSDVIVGAARYTNGQPAEGRALLYLGSATGLGSTHAWAMEGNQGMAWLGISVGTAGDVNGDGYSDVIVGASLYNGGQSGEGRAFVYLGSPGGLGLTPAWTADGDQVDAQLGGSVATAGDVNGDGYSDVIVGAEYYDAGQTNEGRAFLYLGSSTGLNLTPAWTAESDQTWALFGSRVATAGDVNGDGYSDVIVGARIFDNPEDMEGRVFLYYGNGGAGLRLNPIQRRFNHIAATDHLGLSGSTTSFGLTGRGRTPFGTGWIKMQWEVKPLGTPFDGTVTGESDWLEGGPTGVSFTDQVESLAPGTVYHWRARFLYHPATTPFQPFSRWVSPFANGWQEGDFRTVAVAPIANAGPDQTVKEMLGVALIGFGSSDPNGDTLTYHWIQLSGTPVILAGSEAPIAAFTAPWLPSRASQILTFQLTVSDGVHFASDQVAVTVTPHTFLDVTPNHIFYPYVEQIVARSITAGCGTELYCVDNPVTRAQMAVFLLKAKYGASYTPPAATGTFTDVPAGYWARTWVEQFAREGITAGCGPTTFCPDSVVTRAQMAIFLLKAKHGTSYVPPAATGLFTDVPAGHWARTWIEQLARESITAGCSATTYCPDNPVTRGQMAVFLSRTFGF
ncbi:MAG: hypothetical protein EHM23_13765, partial [Acidobacteria bacterium]